MTGGVLAEALPAVAWGASVFSGHYWPRLDSHTRLALNYWDTGQVNEPRADVQFRLVAARGSLCPLEHDIGLAASVSLCASIEGGLLIAKGFPNPPSVVDAYSDRVFWAALGLDTRLRIVGRTLFGELSLESSAPLVHQEFAFKGPEARIHAIPWSNLALTAGAGMAFP